MTGSSGFSVCTRSRGSAIAAVGVLVAGLLVVPSAHAFLGLETGDEIDTLGFTIPDAGGVYTDNLGLDEMTITAVADDITTTSPEVLLEIQGGAIAVDLDLVSESLIFLSEFSGSYAYKYTASFNGDISLNAPTGGPAAEQDGRLLASGSFLSDTVDVTITFDTLNLLGIPTLTAGGTFEITGGDATFLSAFGSTGEFADFITISSTSVPGIDVLLADGFLFSERDTDLLGTGCGGQANSTECFASILNSDGDFVFSGNGEVQPLSGAPFVPEPSTMALLVAGLLGAVATGRRES